MPEPAPRASRVLRLKRLLLVGIHGKGPPRERSERFGCKQSNLFPLVQSLGDCSIANAPVEELEQVCVAWYQIYRILPVGSNSFDRCLDANRASYLSLNVFRPNEFGPTVLLPLVTL